MKIRIIQPIRHFYTFACSHISKKIRREKQCSSNEEVIADVIPISISITSVLSSGIILNDKMYFKFYNRDFCIES